VASGVPFARIAGTGDARFQAAVDAIDALLLASE